MSSTKKICHVREQQQFSVDVDQKMDFINALDYCTLQQIFLLLPINDRMNMHMVCTKWKDACKRAWFNIKKYKCSHSIGGAYNNRLLTQSYVENLILNCGIYLQELILSNICASSIMTIVGEHCKNLTKLEFVIDGRLLVDKDNYIQALKKLDKIKTIKIHVDHLVSGQMKEFESEILFCLPEEINEIHILLKRVCVRLKYPLFIDLKKFKNLYGLTLSGCNLDEMIAQISEKSTLVYLNLENSLISYKFPYEGFLMFDKLVNLEHIHLFKNFDDVDLHLLEKIFDTCKSLRYFKASPSQVIVPPPVVENWENLKNLEYFSVTWDLRNGFADGIVSHCNDLKCLFITKRITPVALLKLTELKNLERLEFRISRPSDNSIRVISNNCKQLKHLEIPNNRNLCDSDTDDDDDNDIAVDTEYGDVCDDDNDEPVLYVNVLDELSKLEYLESLNVSGVHEFFDSSIFAVAKKCKGLKYLNISDCKRITKAGLNAIITLKSLQKLNITNLKSVTDSFIIKLKDLTFLEANKCQKITDFGIIQFIKNCPDLEHLYLVATNVTIHTIMAADRETEHRKNDIILNLYSSSSMIKKSCRPIIKSIWLVIHYRK